MDYTVPIANGQRASHILVKYKRSARPASWRDPEGVVISQRSKGEAVETLEDIWEELDQLSGTQRAARFAELAREVSDCGSAREGGDLGELALDTMAEEFAEAFEALGVGDLSDVLETESGLHIILRTVVTSSYRMLHVLIKHQESARQASWRDPEGALISQRT